MSVHSLFGRSDYGIIGDLVPPRSRVLDLGCGEAELLAWLKTNKNCEVRGVDLSPAKVQKAIARGVSVYQGDIIESLADYPPAAFDIVILSQTLQETLHPLQVLRDMLRVGQEAIVAFPNFAHWKVRWAHLVSGSSPKTDLFPYDWYESPNLNYVTVLDFEALCAKENWRIQHRFCLTGHREVKWLPNLLAEVAVYRFRKS